jgi:hypothetical protein
MRIATIQMERNAAIHARVNDVFGFNRSTTVRAVASYRWWGGGTVKACSQGLILPLLDKAKSSTMDGQNQMEAASAHE